MNFKMVGYFLGWVLKIEAIMMLFPCLIAIIYREKQGLFFLAVAIFCAGLGAVCAYQKPQNTVFYAKEGFVCVSLSWIVMSFFGALPFYFSREIPIFEDAMFETISGFSTTGATILENVEDLSQCMMMWRSLTHWIGGMGVLVFLLALLPMAGGYNIHIMRAESPGPSVGKLVPRVRSTAKILYCIYLAMTFTQILLLLIGGMPWFECLTITFGSAGTGGFGLLSDSMMSYTSYEQFVTAIFMILFGVNFNVYFLFLTHRPKDALRCEEVRIYFVVILVSTLMIAGNIRGFFDDIGMALHHSFFQVASMITTTGFTSDNYNAWPTFSRSILFILVFVGACAGSTAGGMKISRVAIAIKSVFKEISLLLHPRSVRVLRFEGKTVEHHTLRSINAYFIAYLLLFAGSTLLVSLDGQDVYTTASAVIATISNLGPGLGQVSPSGSFHEFSALSKAVLMLDMLAGRFEIFPILILFSPRTWSK